MKYVGRITVAECRTIEDRLNQQVVGSVGLGSLLNDLLAFGRQGKRFSIFREAGMGGVRTVRLSPSLSGARCGPSISNKIVFTRSSISWRSNERRSPFTQALRDSAVIVSNRRDDPDVDAHSPVVYSDQLGPLPLKDWRRSFRQPLFLSSVQLVSLLRTLSLNPALATALWHGLILQTLRLTQALRWFASQRPRALVVEYDRGGFCSPLVAAATALAIPTFTFVHGAVGPEGYAPLLADWVLCDGERQRARFLRLGVERSRALVVGSATKSIGAPHPPILESPLRLLYATNNDLPIYDRINLAVMVLEAVVQARSHWVMTLRSHPSENIAIYKSAMRGRTDVGYSDGSLEPIAGVLVAADLVACRRSTIADDAALLGRDTILVDLPGGGGWRDVGACELAPYATDASSLASVLDRWADDPRFRERQALITEGAARELVALTGEAAIARTLDGLLRPPERLARRPTQPARQLDVSGVLSV